MPFSPSISTSLPLRSLLPFLAPSLMYSLADNMETRPIRDTQQSGTDHKSPLCLPCAVCYAY